MPNKNIVICCDGTGNELGENNTNVVLTFEKIERNNQQIGFYDPGVGTFDVFGFNVGKRGEVVYPVIYTLLNESIAILKP